LALTLIALLLFSGTNAFAYPEHKDRGKCYIIGTGPAGPEHATAKALECIKKAEVVFGSSDTLERFSMVWEQNQRLCIRLQTKRLKH